MACKKIWKGKRQDPPCAECRHPLDDENAEAVTVFQAVKNHVVTRQVDKEKVLVDIDIKAVKAAMDIYDVKNRPACLEKVRKLFSEMSKEQG